VGPIERLVLHPLAKFKVLLHGGGSLITQVGGDDVQVLDRVCDFFILRSDYDCSVVTAVCLHDMNIAAKKVTSDLSESLLDQSQRSQVFEVEHFHDGRDEFRRCGIPVARRILDCLIVFGWLRRVAFLWSNDSCFVVSQRGEVERRST